MKHSFWGGEIKKRREGEGEEEKEKKRKRGREREEERRRGRGKRGREKEDHCEMALPLIIPIFNMRSTSKVYYKCSYNFDL
jgi:hypothetical protein